MSKIRKKMPKLKSKENREPRIRREYICCECSSGKDWGSASHLKRHKESHTGSVPCGCGRKFKTSESVRRHRRLTNCCGLPIGVPTRSALVSIQPLVHMEPCDAPSAPPKSNLAINQSTASSLLPSMPSLAGDDIEEIDVTDPNVQRRIVEDDLEMSDSGGEGPSPEDSIPLSSMTLRDPNQKPNGASENAASLEESPVSLTLFDSDLGSGFPPDLGSIVTVELPGQPLAVTEMLYPCSFCQMPFTAMAKVVHEIKVHLPHLNTMCVECEVVFTSHEARAHHDSQYHFHNSGIVTDLVPRDAAIIDSGLPLDSNTGVRL